MKKIITMILAAIMILSLAACAGEKSAQIVSEVINGLYDVDGETDADATEESVEDETEEQTEFVAEEQSDKVTLDGMSSDGLLDSSDMFTERDLTQSADTSDAEQIALTDGEDAVITSAGVYVLSGSAENFTLTVNASKDDKVQIVLDGVSITNDDAPCIYVKCADKVFVTTTGSDNYLSVTGKFSSDGTTNTDAVIFSKDDLVLNGVGTLTVKSTDNGITSKDDLKITGGTLTVVCESDALEVNDSIRIADGDITIRSNKDGLHAENGDDDSLGYVYICGGTLNVTASDDAIHAVSVVQIDAGDLTLTGAECIEGTYIQINGGSIDITASDDGINGARKSSAYTAAVEINGGYIKIAMGQGDTDGIDSNGNLFINGGTLNITAQSPFDYDGTAQHNGGTIIVNGTETDTVTNQMMGGGMGGVPGGMQGGMPNGMQGGPGGRG